MQWYLWALGSTIFWGIFYLLVSRLSGTLTPISMYWLPNFLLVLMIPFTYQTITKDYIKLWHSGYDIKVIALVASVASIAASLMFYKALASGNATAASLIQISYPLFVGIFSLIIFNDNQFTPSTIIGGSLIMAGVGLMVYSA